MLFRERPLSDYIGFTAARTEAKAAAGGTEVGPFRVGEVFPYEGKKFAVVGREGRKIQLLNQSEAGQGAFWVPVEAGAPADADKP